jgi:TRAP-type C4-dicarboxylate transport system permease small subunit
MDMLKLRKVLDTFLVWAVCILTTVLLVVMSAQVLWRYVFNDPIYWSEELARYLFVWLTFLAASMAFRDHKHMAVDLFQPLLGPTARRWQRAIITGILAIFFVVVLIIAPEILGITFDQPSASLNIPIALLYLSFPFSIFIMLLYLVMDLVQARKAR